MAGAGVTTGNSRARLPPGLGVDRPGTVPRGNAGGWASGPVTAVPAAELPLWPGGAGPLGEAEGDRLGEAEGLGDGDLLGEGDGLGDGDLLGDGDGEGDGDLDGDGLGEGDLLGDGDGDGEGLGEGDLVGDGDGDGEGDVADRVGEGDGDAVAAAPVLPRIAMRIPAASAPPPARMRAPGRGRAGPGP
jgi:hypothetical protein